MAIYLYVVDPQDLENACRTYLTLCPITHWSGNNIDSFNKEMGLTKDMYLTYEETGKLRVNKVTYEKIQFMAAGPSAHWQTMLRIIEVKYGSTA